MKSAYLVLLITFLISASCTDKKSAGNQTGEAHIIDSTKSEIEVPQKQIKSDTFYRATGNEPGWAILISKNNTDTLEFNLLLDYGELKFNGIAELISSDEDSGMDSFKLKSNNEELHMKIVKEECVDESGSPNATSITLKYNERIYLGCGNYKGATNK